MGKRSRAMISGAAFGLAVGVLAALLGLPSDACLTAGVTALCAWWWVTEALPIPATSLVPFVAFPLFGVLDHEDVARAYGHYLILLLLGGFILSRAIERSGAHRRLAVTMVRAVGGFGRRGLILGFMLATALSSMWISNTATVLMLLPVAQAVLAEDGSQDLELPLLLGIAYAASIGGLGTPIGTPPNLVFMMNYQTATGIGVSFLEWMAWGLPVVAVFIPLAWLVLSRNVRTGEPVPVPRVGAWTTGEKRVLAVFAVTALAWITLQVPFGGWKTWIPFAGDETVALAAVVAMFVIPDGRGERLLDWPTAAQIPWGLLLLFGGGIAIAEAFRQSGLSEMLGRHLTGIVALPKVVFVGSIALAVTFLTEITSNTATTVLLMPVFAAASLAAGIDPRLMMVPAAMSASCAFMLPVATAPNAIVFGTERFTIRDMAREGLKLNLIGAVVITAVCVLML